MHKAVWTSLSSDITEDANRGFLHTRVLFPPMHAQQLQSREEHWCHRLYNCAACFALPLPVRWPMYPSGADGIAPCAWSWPCPAHFSGLATCGKILTFISPTGPAAADTRSTSDPYAQVPAFTICPIATSPPHTHTHTHTFNAHADAYTGMSDTSWPLAVPTWISRREATCNVRGDFRVKEVRLESSHIARPAWATQLPAPLSWVGFVLFWREKHSY